MGNMNTWLSLQAGGWTNFYICAEPNQWVSYVGIMENSLSYWQTGIFRFVPGLANSGLVSIESKQYPGHYLRHKDWRIHLSPNDGSDLMKKDATWFIRDVGNGNIRIESYNYPSFFIRHHDKKLWITVPRGNTPENNPHLWVEDSTFKIVAPLSYP